MEEVKQEATTESVATEQPTQDVKNENDELKNVIKALETKIDAQQKMLEESNNKFKSFVSDYMNKKHEEIKQEAEKVLDDNDPSYEY